MRYKVIALTSHFGFHAPVTLKLGQGHSMSSLTSDYGHTHEVKKMMVQSQGVMKLSRLHAYMHLHGPPDRFW